MDRRPMVPFQLGSHMMVIVLQNAVKRIGLINY